MKKCLLTSIKISLIMLGSIVGAGFATGKEITTFFGIYGKYAPHLIVGAGLFFFISLFTFFTSGKLRKNNGFSYFFNVLIFIAEFILVASMISALFSVTKIFLSNTIIVYFLILLCFIISLFGTKGLTFANIILSPILILSVVTVSIISLTKTSLQVSITPSSFFQKLSFPFLYSGLNLFTSYPLCRETGKSMSKKEIVITSIITSCIITISISLILFAILKSPQNVIYSEMPLAILACSISPTIGFIFFFIIIIGIITTLISALYALTLYNKKATLNKYVYSALIIILTYILSLVGFNGIITIFYPLIGIFGVVLFLVLFAQKFKYKSQDKILCKKII